MKRPKRHMANSHKDISDKITDAAFMRSVIISVIGIVVCMTCLLGLTWAWFSTSVSSGTNEISASTFDLEITLKEEGGDEPLTVNEEGFYDELAPEKTYLVSILRSGTAKTGFCQLLVFTEENSDQATPYYTANILKTGEDDEEETTPFVFKISGINKVKFIPMWGTNSVPVNVIENDASFSLGAKSKKTADKSAKEEEEEEEEVKKEDEVKEEEGSSEKEEEDTSSETEEIKETSSDADVPKENPESEPAENDTPESAPDNT